MIEIPEIGPNLRDAIEIVVLCIFCAAIFIRGRQ